MISRQRVDRFISVGSNVSIIGRRDHTFSTEQFIERPHLIKFYQEAEDNNAPFYYPGPRGLVGPWPSANKVPAHLKDIYPGLNGDEPVLTFSVKPYAINESIESLIFDCPGVQNTQECRPREQVKLLPYICDKMHADNIYSSTLPVTPILQNTRYGNVVDFQDDITYRYYPAEQDRFFITAVDNNPAVATQQAFIQSVAATGTRFVESLGLDAVLPPAVWGADVSRGVSGLPFVRMPDNGVDIGGGLFQPTWRLDLADSWHFVVDVREFGHPAVIPGRALKFAFPANSRMDLRFDEYGFAETINASQNAIPDTEDFHIFHMYNRAGGAGPPFGTMVQGGLPEANQLQNGLFPRDVTPDLFLYLPKRRFARGTDSAGMMNPFLKTQLNLPAYDNILTQQFQNLTWAVRNSLAPGHFYNGLFDIPQLLDKNFGTVRPMFENVDDGITGPGDTRDKTIQLTGLFIDGRMRDMLNESVTDGGVPAGTKYFFVIEYPKSLHRQVVDGNVVYQLTDDPRYEVVFFTKDQVIRVDDQDGVIRYDGEIQNGDVIALGEDVMKRPGTLNKLYYNEAEEALIAAVNAGGAGDDLPYQPLLAGGLPNIIKDFNNQVVAGIVDGDRNQNRPGGFAAGTLPPNNYTIADEFFDCAPPENAYYRIFEDPFGGGDLEPIEDVHGEVRYFLPHPNWPEEEDVDAQNAPFFGDPQYPDAIGDPLFVSDPNFAIIREALRGNIHLVKIPTNFFVDHPIPIVRSQGSVTLTEPLLGFQGMSPFFPKSIYPVVEKLPALMQDFNYRITQREMNDVILDAHVTLANVNQNAVASLSPVGNYTLTMRSTDDFKQEDKELQVVELAWPRFEIFQTISAYNVAPQLSIETIRGVPDYFFIRLERVNTQTRVIENQPVIKTLKFEMLNQDIKSVSAMNENQLYHATRRNSHVHADSRVNQRVTGAVLLHRNDIGSLSEFQDKPGWDTLKLDVTVTDFHVFYPGVDYTNINPTDDIRLKVSFIYLNYGVKGRPHEAEFWWR